MATGTTILVVDDDDSILVLMRSLLRQHGFDPVTASSGAEALEKVSGAEPGVVLLDLGLQDMDGEELIARLRARGSEIPVIIVSGRHLSDDEIGSIGATDALQKPFDVEDLVRAIRHSLETIGC